MRSMDKNDPQYRSLVELANKVIGLFAQKPVKTKSMVEEVAMLAGSEDEDVIHEVLEKITNELTHSRLLNIGLLEGLTLAFEQANPDYLDSDDLIQVLRVLNEKLESTIPKVAPSKASASASADTESMMGAAKGVLLAEDKLGAFLGSHSRSGAECSGTGYGLCAKSRCQCD